MNDELKYLGGGCWRAYFGYSPSQESPWNAPSSGKLCSVPHFRTVGNFLKTYHQRETRVKLC